MKFILRLQLLHIRSGNLTMMKHILKELSMLLYDRDFRIKFSEPEKSIRFITYFMEQSPSWEAKWFCS